MRPLRQRTAVSALGASQVNTLAEPRKRAWRGPLSGGVTVAARCDWRVCAGLFNVSSTPGGAARSARASGSSGGSTTTPETAPHRAPPAPLACRIALPRTTLRRACCLLSHLPPHRPPQSSSAPTRGPRRAHRGSRLQASRSRFTRSRSSRCRQRCRLLLRARFLRMRPPAHSPRAQACPPAPPACVWCHYQPPSLAFLSSFDHPAERTGSVPCVVSLA